MSKLSPFHLAIPVDNLEISRKFYREILGFKEGRSSDLWVDFDFFGHQLVIHLEEKVGNKKTAESLVDGKSVPIPHFGVVLEWNDFQAFAKHLKQQQIQFEIEPYIRYKGKEGEQASMFFYDPSNNALEFKAFKNKEHLFVK